MADPSSYPGSKGDTSDGIGVESDRGSSAGTPRWVYVFGIIALVLVLLFAIVMLIGAGGHGPGRHASPGDAGGHAPSSSVTEQSMQQP
jgi:hypothetical protein